MACKAFGAIFWETLRREKLTTPKRYFYIGEKQTCVFVFQTCIVFPALLARRSGAVSICIYIYSTCISQGIVRYDENSKGNKRIYDGFMEVTS